MTFEIIKRNFDKGLWTDLMVHKAVDKGVITPEQYEQIVGRPY